jgi:hypothetical protein
MRPGLALALFASTAWLGCGATPESGSGEPPRDPAERQAQIETLRAEVAEDHARLETMISEERDPEATPVHRDPEMRAIAERLAERAAALERLERSDDGDTPAKQP